MLAPLDPPISGGFDGSLEKCGFYYGPKYDVKRSDASWDGNIPVLGSYSAPTLPHRGALAWRQRLRLEPLLDVSRMSRSNAEHQHSRDIL
jgi:hypothetical protein